MSTDDRENPVLAEIDTMLGDPRYNFAADTLKGIYDTVKRTNYLTSGQARAVKNIKTSVEERDERPNRFGGWGRRYDGYGG